MTRTVWTNFRSPVPRRLHMKFGFNRHSGFRWEDVWKCWHTHIRTTEAYLYFLWAQRLRWAKNENLMFLKLSSKREKFEWYWHPESNLIPNFHDFSMIFINFQIPLFFHALMFSRACGNSGGLVIRRYQISSIAIDLNHSNGTLWTENAPYMTWFQHSPWCQLKFTSLYINQQKLMVDKPIWGLYFHEYSKNSSCKLKEFIFYSCCPR